MSRVLLSVVLVYGLSIVFAPPALAVNCDLNTCMNINCRGKGGNILQSCTSWCQITMADRKKSGQCK
jgi:hypothetical protein